MKKKFDDSKSSIGLWFAWASMAIATFIFIYLIIINFTVSTQIIG